MADAVATGASDTAADGVANSDRVCGPAALLQAVAKRPTTRAAGRLRIHLRVAITRSARIRFGAP